MKHCKKIGLALLALVLLAVLFWKFPICWMLGSVRLPEGCEDFRTEVVYSDIYAPHILGERVIVTAWEQNALENFIAENNPRWLASAISVAPFFREWDDFAVLPYDYEAQVPPADRDTYFVITYYQPISPFQ